MPATRQNPTESSKRLENALRFRHIAITYSDVRVASLHDLRRQRQLSREALARAARLPLDRLDAIDRGASASQAELAALSSALGVPTYTLKLHEPKVEPLPSDFRTMRGEIVDVSPQGLSAMYRMQGAIRLFNTVKDGLSILTESIPYAGPYWVYT